MRSRVAAIDEACAFAETGMKRRTRPAPHGHAPPIASYLESRPGRADFCIRRRLRQYRSLACSVEESDAAPSAFCLFRRFLRSEDPVVVAVEGLSATATPAE
jgi:hypothetical protein